MTRGLNVWFDLLTTDTSAAERFYGEALGWTTQVYREADPNEPYTMWLAGDKPIGGVMVLPARAAAMGAPPHWMGYTTVDDVDESAAFAQKLGGKLHAGPFDVPTVGRMAVLADPQGAVFALFRPLGHTPAPRADAIGEVGWSELNTTDYEAAFEFYRQLFGWKERGAMDMGPPVGTYFMWNDPSETTKGGMSNAATMMQVPAHWLYYVTVRDMSATLACITRAGGKVLNGPMDVPGDDVIAQCQDPQGAMFAVYAHKQQD